MALLFDGAKEATATTGTGDVTLGGAPPGFTRFSDFDLCTDGCLVHYVIEDGTSREVGIGTWNTGNTLSRTTIHNTLVGTTVTENPGTGLNLSGSAVVFSAVTAHAGNDIDVTRYPVVRPSLNLDFANSEQVDPRITFVRDTTATRFNELGLLESVDANEPRIDYDPVTGECLGLLIEEQRTNLLTYSEQFDNAIWVKTRSSISANATTAPDGTLTVDKLVEDGTSSNTHQLSRTNSFTSGVTYTYSLFCKADTRTDVALGFGGVAFTPSRIRFNLSTGMATVESGSAIPSIELIGSWFRCSITLTASSTNTDTIYTYLHDSSSVNYTGDGTSGIYIWGAQLEEI